MPLRGPDRVAGRQEVERLKRDLEAAKAKLKQMEHEFSYSARYLVVTKTGFLATVMLLVGAFVGGIP